MSSVVPPRRPVVLRASRDTLVLLAAASALAMAIGYSAHNRPAASPSSNEGPALAGDWTGQLASLAPAEPAMPAPAEPMSSDALTVPKAAMALPAAPKPAPSSAKPHLCDGAPCPAPGKPALSTSAATPAATVPAANHRSASGRPHPIREASLVDRLNPLNHLPDMVKRPFASAGDAIAGWMKRF